MPKNYAYRMYHDKGFAPNIKYGICTLSGCKNSKNGKRRNIEESAEKGSWIIGIGGNNTGMSNRLIYVMEVEENLPYSEFKKRYPRKHNEYLRQKKLGQGEPGTNVLVSRKFYYFGNHALDLPKSLKHIIIDRWGCKCMSDKDIHELKNTLQKEGYKPGRYGEPNNEPLELSQSYEKC